MKLINKDMTRESITLFITGTQIYAEIFSKTHGKWGMTTYFQSYDWKIDEELVRSTITRIIREWHLTNPQVVIE